MSNQRFSQPDSMALDALVAAVKDDGVLDKVHGYARKRLRACHLPAEPVDVEQIVRDAIADTATGRRAWDPTRVPASTHLCGVIRNHTRVLVQKAVKASIQVFTALESPDGREFQFPVDETRAKEIRDIVSRIYDLLMRAATMKGDNDVQNLLAALQLGASARSEIAEMTGMSAEDVTRARRRLESLIAALPAELRWDAIETLREVSA